MNKARIATIWLDGCSGCHMSLLDIDERLLDLAGKIDLVYSPVVDIKEIPTEIDVGIIEGAISSEEDAEKARLMRERSRILVALGDCAVNSNVPSMRNSFSIKDLMRRAYVENATCSQQIPDQTVPALMRRARPVHEFVKVDLHVPGCPPPADAIFFVLSELLEGRVPEPTALSKFG